MFCTNCGAQIPDGSGFCTNCGTRLTAPETAPATEPVSAAEVTSATEAAPVTETVPTAEEAPVTEPAPAAEASSVTEPESAAETAPVESMQGMEEDSKTIAITPMDAMPGVQPNAAQMQYTNPQMNPQMQQMNYENPQAGMAYGNPQTGMQYGTPMMNNGMQYAQMPPKKKFVMPMVVDVILGILAVVVITAFVLVMIFGKPKADELSANEVQATAITENPKSNQTEVLSIDMSGKSFSLEIPENEAYQQAQEMANGYIIEDSNSRYLEYDELWNYTEDELFMAYFELYARAGFDMSELDEDLASYFESKSWYNPTLSFMDDSIQSLSDVMNEYEVANVELIEEFLDNEWGYADEELSEME